MTPQNFSGPESGDREQERETSHGVAGFFRSLLSNVPWNERSEREENFEFESPRAGKVRVHNPNGRTAVYGEDRDDVTLRAVKVARAECTESAEKFLDQIEIRAEQVDGVLEVEVEIPQRWKRLGLANLELRLPRKLSVELVSSNGRLDVEGLHGKVRARSSNGSAILRDIVGDVRVATSNAKVLCSRTVGRLVARSSNGKIELDDHTGSVDASTSNGPIRVSLHEVGDDGVNLATSNGRIVLALPEVVDCEVDVRVDNGTIRNDRQLCKCTREGNGRILGRLGDGGALVKLRTSNGSISLR
jgi:hypothetical protein